MGLFKNTKQLILIVATLIIGVATFLLLTTFGQKRAETIDNSVEPVIELTTTKVMLHTGDDFDALTYVKTATNSQGEDISREIEAPTLDTTNPGTYDVIYMYQDNGKTIKSKILKVIVAN